MATPAAGKVEVVFTIINGEKQESSKYQVVLSNAYNNDIGTLVVMAAEVAAVVKILKSMK